MFFQNILWNRKHVTINSSKEETVLSRDSKEVFVQRFVYVFDQNRKHVEARYHCNVVELSETATRGVL